MKYTLEARRSIRKGDLVEHLTLAHQILCLVLEVKGNEVSIVNLGTGNVTRVYVRTLRMYEGNATISN